MIDINLKNCDECCKLIETCECYNSKAYLEGLDILEELNSQTDY